MKSNRIPPDIPFDYAVPYFMWRMVVNISGYDFNGYSKIDRINDVFGFLDMKLSRKGFNELLNKIIELNNLYNKEYHIKLVKDTKK